MGHLRWQHTALIVPTALAGACGGDGRGSPDAASVPDPVPVSDCFQTDDGVAIMEAESLPLASNWRLGADGDIRYMEWSLESHNDDSSVGRSSVELEVSSPGVYRLQWRARVGQGDDPTEHNDAWVRFPDADEFYGEKGAIRVYPRPLCEDSQFLASTEAMDGVDEARCPEGSSDDGFFKVYSSGALDWRWSARTNDGDGFDVLARFDTARSYTFEIAARADFFQLDRVVIHRTEAPDEEVRSTERAETRCR